MDRFIDTLRLPAVVIYIYLKSNMDRFIGSSSIYSLNIDSIFKIQYG